jgi:alkylation response protein AidB-like acyl-CoA dehydrogenase
MQMDFALTEEQKMLRQMAIDFVAKEVTPVIVKMEKDEAFPFETFRKLGEIGITGLTIPEAYGGSGGDEMGIVTAFDELAKGWPSLVAIVSTHICLCTQPILNFGTENQKQKYVPKLARGEMIGAFGATEPESGSDILSARTFAVRDGNHYVLNGVKTFITNGPVCDVIMVLASTDKARGAKGLSAFLVEKGTPGFSVGSVFDKMGMRGAPTAEMVFDNCRIPAENRLGEEGQGAKIFLNTLDIGRIGIASQAMGIIHGVLDACVVRSKERVQFGRPIADYQAIQWMLADMSTDLDAARLLCYQAAFLSHQGLPYGREAAAAKLFASEAAMRAATNGVQIFGGYGYVTESPMQRYFRDAKLIEIYEGTSQMQRIVIARHVLRQGANAGTRS